MLLAALFVIPKTNKDTKGKQHKCPSIGEWLNNLRYFDIKQEVCDNLRRKKTVRYYFTG